jgi:hypothetical protein
MQNISSPLFGIGGPSSPKEFAGPALNGKRAQLVITMG